MHPFDADAMIAEFDRLAADLKACYEALPPAAKANCIRLAHSLSAVRKRLDGERCLRVAAQAAGSSASPNRTNEG